MGKRIIIIADIEGSSGCLTRESARFLGRGWPGACRDMSRDAAVLTRELLNAGARQVRIQDFHRTGYNLFPALIPGQVTLTQGYRRGPVPGMGNPGVFDGLMMVGMHAPSGTGGFLAHTLTSRIAQVSVDGQPVSEAQLFAAALAPLGIPPLFFSGCPVACDQVLRTMPGVRCWPIEKSDPGFDPGAWRAGMARQAVQTLAAPPPGPYNPQGPFEVTVTLAGGRAVAARIARSWRCRSRGADLLLPVADFNGLFATLSRIIYLSPLMFRLLPLVLPLYHLAGRAGLAWAQKKAPVRRADRG